ncbi:MAG: PilZ domain-containing protein [Terriglobia bacterium]
MLDLWKVKRNEARIVLAIPVTIEGLDKSSVHFCQETVTDNVSKNGVCIVLDQSLDLGAVLTVTACHGKFKCRGEVRALWVDDNDRKKRVGVRFVDPIVNWVVG